MKKHILLVLCLIATLSASAKNGYRVTVKFTDLRDTLVYLAHYYAKPLPNIYKTDSARFDKNGVAVIQNGQKITGGIYIILLADKKTFFEFLLDNGDEMTITAKGKNFPEGASDDLSFQGSSKNDEFLAYMRFLKDFGARQQTIQGEFAIAKGSADSAAVRKKLSASGKDLIKYRRTYAAAHPGSLLTSVFNALETPEIPEGTHYLANGKVDSNFAYNYYKAHYWDYFNFRDDRLMYTPIYDAKLEEYFNRLVVPSPDSVTREADTLLSRTKGTEELFKYSLMWLSRNTETSKIMGMDQAFYYLVEQYILRGEAPWLDNDILEKYRDRISKIGPNMIGNVAPEILMEQYGQTKPTALSSVKGKYTLVVFWDPTCGHCMMEIPKLDSLYDAALKGMGVKVYAVRTEGPVDKWQETIKKLGLQDWVNVYDPEHHSDFRSKYDIYSTPVIYLLDEKKIIRGKRLDHSNIIGLIEMLEKRNKTAGAQPKS